MRIVHLAALVGRMSGGVGQVALGLCKAQNSLGMDATIWSLDSKQDIQHLVADHELSGRIKTWSTIGPRIIGYSPELERQALSRVGRDVDILHQHSIWMANSRVTNRWRATFGRPTVVAPHGTLEEYALRRSAWKKWLASLWYEAKNLRLASCLHTASKAGGMSLRNYGLRNPIAVIPNGIPDTWIRSFGDADRFCDRHSVPPDKRLLLFLSRLHPIKGLPILFEAMALIRQQLADWYLVIAGPDEMGHRRELQLLSERLGIPDLIQFVGPLFGSEKRDALAATDVFILPTHSEDFAIIIVEALGAGVPVLTTRGAPWEELCDHRCGWWVDVSTSAIRDALLDAIQRPKDELVEMGQRGKTLVARKYTWSQVARKSLMLYEWLLGVGDRPDFVITD